MAPVPTRYPSQVPKAPGSSRAGWHRAPGGAGRERERRENPVRAAPPRSRSPCLWAHRPRKQAKPSAGQWSALPHPCLLAPPEGLPLLGSLPDCYRPHRALCAAAPRAGPRLPRHSLNCCWPRPSWTARPLPAASLSEQGSWGSPGPADKGPGHCQRGRQLRLRSAEARRVFTCRGPDHSHNCPGIGGASAQGCSRGPHLNRLPDSRSQIQSNLVKVGGKVI